VSVTLALSVEGLTVKTAIIAGLAIAALLLTGWRKPARAEPRSPLRRSPPGQPFPQTRQQTRQGILVEHLDTPIYHRPGPIRRVLALGASGGLGVLIGLLSAIVISFTVAFAVIWLTNLLQR
jgi:hypothetical protein